MIVCVWCICVICVYFLFFFGIFGVFGVFGEFFLVLGDFVVFPQCSPSVVVFLRVVFSLWWLFFDVFVVFVCVEFI